MARVVARAVARVEEQVEVRPVKQMEEREVEQMEERAIAIPPSMHRRACSAGRSRSAHQGAEAVSAVATWAVAALAASLIGGRRRQEARAFGRRFLVRLLLRRLYRVPR